MVPVTDIQGYFLHQGDFPTNSLVLVRFKKFLTLFIFLFEMKSPKTAFLKKSYLFTFITLNVYENLK